MSLPETVTVKNPTISPKIKAAGLASVGAILLLAALTAVIPEDFAFLGEGLARIAYAVVVAAAALLAGYLKRDPDREWVVAGDPVPGDEATPRVLDGEVEESEILPEPENAAPDDGLPDATYEDEQTYGNPDRLDEVDATPPPPNWAPKH